MTKEELEKYAEEYVKNLEFAFETDVVQRIVRERVRLVLIAVLEQREKRIEELEKKIRKIRDYLAYKIPYELMNEAINKIWNMV